MIHIQVAEELGSDPLPVAEEILEAAAQVALQVGAAAEESELTLVLTGDAEIQELNRTYLDIDAPTDVLSFPAGELDPDSDSLYLGDIILSLPRAQVQAAAGDHALADELRLLVVHGVLHLLGHDHAEPEERAIMWRLQAEALTRLGSPQVAPPLE